MTIDETVRIHRQTIAQLEQMVATARIRYERAVPGKVDMTHPLFRHYRMLVTTLDAAHAEYRRACDEAYNGLW